MDQRILAVRTGNRYGQSYETYLKSKLPGIQFINQDVLTFERQWNKLSAMMLDSDQPVCVMDIDVALINDYEKIFDHPIEPGQFLALHSWWPDTVDVNYSMNGGFYKFFPKDCRSIAEKFLSDPQKWLHHYVQNGTTQGYLNGEQYFVEDSVKELGLELTYLPDSWHIKWGVNPNEQFIIESNLAYPGDYAYIDQFNTDIKFVHYMNQPSSKFL